MEIDLQKRFGE